MAEIPDPAASALDNHVKTVVPQINSTVRTCKEKYEGHMQPAVDGIVALCLEMNLAYKKNILVRHCGIHPENRAKTGVDPFNAQSLVLKISSYSHINGNKIHNQPST